MRTGKAKLLKRFTADGTDFVYEHVPIGHEYTVDLDSLTMMTWDNDNKLNDRPSIQTLDENGQIRGWYPIELLDIPELETRKV